MVGRQNEASVQATVMIRRVSSGPVVEGEKSQVAFAFLFFFVVVV